jgi:hypothetical protein
VKNAGCGKKQRRQANTAENQSHFAVGGVRVDSEGAGDDTEAAEYLKIQPAEYPLLAMLEQNVGGRLEIHDIKYELSDGEVVHRHYERSSNDFGGVNSLTMQMFIGLNS